VAMSPHAKALAQDMYQALWSFLVCVIVTVVVSLATKPKTDSELNGLVYGLTQVPSVGNVPIYQNRFFGPACGRRIFRPEYLLLVAGGCEDDFHLVFHRDCPAGGRRADFQRGMYELWHRQCTPSCFSLCMHRSGGADCWL